MARALSVCCRRMSMRWFSVSPKSAVSDPEKNPLTSSSTGSTASIGMSTAVQSIMGGYGQLPISTQSHSKCGCSVIEIGNCP